MRKRFLIPVVLLCLATTAYPEGTRQVAPFPAAMGWLCIDKSRNDFAFFDASPEFRINITIANTSETINFGLGSGMDKARSGEVQYRIKDPAGNIVLGPAPLPTSGAGAIPSYNQAIAGPFPAAGGYQPLQYSPATTGDYALEFYYPPDSAAFYTEPGRKQFEFFDITITDVKNQEIPGRVWSKAWQFNCGPVEAPPTQSRFWGIMYILSDDSIVTSVNCNGFVGGTFSISSNRTGCSTTGGIAVDRQSREGFHTYPQYRIFLNDPDSLLFPTGKAQPGILLPITSLPTCNGTVDLGLKVNMDGLVEVFIEVNPKSGADPEDVKITANVFANPGATGVNTIHWNGLDGRGLPVRNGTTVTATIRFIHGITHLPIYDIEYNDNGYIVQVIRPTGNSPAIYWDDSLIPNGGSVNLSGCSNITGCHLWEIAAGNINTLNSWWYVASATAPSISFTVKRKPVNPGVITGKKDVCLGTSGLVYSVVPDTNAIAYQWSYSGTGVSYAGTSPEITLAFTDSATSGNLTVKGYNNECGTGDEALLAVSVHPIPSVKLDVPDTICINVQPVQLTGGSPAGGVYLEDGNPATSIDPKAIGIGEHQVVYHYADPYGCSGSDSASVFVNSGDECSILLWMPDAFTPDGDGLNDHFRPVTRNVGQFSMSIYSRTGQLIFTTENLAEGWDGTTSGQSCPPGCYVYVVVYEASVSPEEFRTVTGNLTLVR